MKTTTKKDHLQDLSQPASDLKFSAWNDGKRYRTENGCLTELLNRIGRYGLDEFASEVCNALVEDGEHEDWILINKEPFSVTEGSVGQGNEQILDWLAASRAHDEDYQEAFRVLLEWHSSHYFGGNEPVFQCTTPANQDALNEVINDAKSLNFKSIKAKSRAVVEFPNELSNVSLIQIKNKKKSDKDTYCVYWIAGDNFGEYYQSEQVPAQVRRAITNHTLPVGCDAEADLFNDDDSASSQSADIQFVSESPTDALKMMELGINCVWGGRGAGVLSIWKTGTVQRQARGKHLVLLVHADARGEDSIQKIYEAFEPAQPAEFSVIRMASLAKQLGLDDVPDGFDVKDYFTDHCDDIDDAKLFLWNCREAFVPPMTSNRGTAKRINRKPGSSITNHHYRHPLSVNNIESQIEDEFDGDPQVWASHLVMRKSDGEFAVMAKPEMLEAFLSGSMGQNVDFIGGAGCPSMKVTFEWLRQNRPVLDSVEFAPHFPIKERTLYGCPIPDACSTMHLEKCLDFFRFETELDRELCRVFWATLVYGWRETRPPVFVITSDHGRGNGKSKVVEYFCQNVFDDRTFFPVYGVKSPGFRSRL
ncbi:hypothetical protein AB1L42_21875 [Thalassoglobus sp. JC818]|uniref:hypothetical protein n=1 Tax=Thalassoglobus sp. JC818 TaxID=3232136 RepID=UPI0034595A84